MRHDREGGPAERHPGAPVLQKAGKEAGEGELLTEENREAGKFWSGVQQRLQELLEKSVDEGRNGHSGEDAAGEIIEESVEHGGEPSIEVRASIIAGRIEKGVQSFFSLEQINRFDDLRGRHIRFQPGELQPKALFLDPGQRLGVEPQVQVQGPDRGQTGIFLEIRLE